MTMDTYLSLIRDEPQELFSQSEEIKSKHYQNTVTYSRNFFVPVTHQCRNTCAYCSFSNPDVSSWINPNTYQIMLESARNARCIEILLTLGEKPEERYASARHFLSKYGFSSTVEYVKSFSERALDYNFLPHSNLGVLSYDELKLLKDVNASMGLMLETSASRLMEEGYPHHNSPGKNPQIRLETIENAGKLKIPFTSGILVGIGENWEERIDSLLKLAELSQKYGHIQEIIVQNLNPQVGTKMENVASPSKHDFLLTVSLARLILPENVSIQVPPNLNRDRLVDALIVGANDIGGISPITVDFINPDETWPDEKELSSFLSTEGFSLELRLPVYPLYEKYLSKRIRNIIEDKYEETSST